MDLAAADPKGLIRESYRIEGITAEECRSIFLDWALSLAAGIVPAEASARLITAYATGQEAHPMTAVLRAGLTAPGRGQRRGGRAARVPQEG
ncbi:hypothetical protein [Phaeovulum sp. W22_SRMD_FR3]|uniref:hypothetical protein n=1 Tax=Phaeovulum sp. W22_SRMD_FR3 TaxID=3240274 RepID=UPI003F962189